MLLSRSSISDAVDYKVIEEQVPEWGGAIRLRQMSAEQSMAMTKAMAAAPEDGMFIILVFCALDDSNAPLFTMDDVPMLRTKNIKVLDRLQRAALRLNSMIGSTEADLKNVSSEAGIAASPTS